jgi:hypothetical protein
MLEVGAWSFRKALVIFKSLNNFRLAKIIFPPVPRLRNESVSEVGRIDKYNNSSLNEEPRSDSRQNNHAKSHQRPGKPGAPQTSPKKS